MSASASSPTARRVRFLKSNNEQLDVRVSATEHEQTAGVTTATTVVPQLSEKLALKNPMQVPRITKITVNMGVGEAVADRKVVDAAAADLAKITGQKPLITKSKKAIASFKLRENLPIGCKVTLRGARMYEFLDRLISDRDAAHPRLPWRVGVARSMAAATTRWA